MCLTPLLHRRRQKWLYTIINNNNNKTSFNLADALFCEEEQWDFDDDNVDQTEQTLETETGFTFNNWDAIWDDNEELLSLFSKERETQIDSNPDCSTERRSAVDWMRRVNTHYGFSGLTAILAVDYLDRFMNRFELKKEKPWTIQLVAVTCLSLAAKVEETQVPLLLDFQVEGAKYVFEAKTIQRMELLVLSTLEWKMNPVTPLSFVDHIIARLGLKCHLHWEFFRQCETILLSVLPDSRFVGYLPSVIATATMLHVIQQVEPFSHIDYQNQLLSVLNLTWEKVNDCYQLIMDLSNTSHNLHQNKRKFELISTYLSSSSADHSNSGSNDTWSNGSSITSSSSSSPEVRPQQKKIRASEQCLRVPSLARVFVNVLGSPH